MKELDELKRRIEELENNHLLKDNVVRQTMKIRRLEIQLKKERKLLNTYKRGNKDDFWN